MIKCMHVNLKQTHQKKLNKKKKNWINRIKTNVNWLPDEPEEETNEREQQRDEGEGEAYQEP